MTHADSVSSHSNGGKRKYLPSTDLSLDTNNYRDSEYNKNANVERSLLKG